MFIKQLYYHRATVMICTICWFMFLLTSNRALVAGYTASLLFLYMACMRFHIGMYSLVYCLIVLVIMLAALSLFIDPDSTKGRLLIYKVSTLIWQDHFISGIGPNRFQAIYNNYQASYFSSGINSPQELMLAGNTYYAFNDYFQFIIENGLAGILVLVSYFSFIIKLVQYLLNNKNEELKSIVFFTSHLIAISFAACFTHIFEHAVAWCLLSSIIAILMLIAANVKIYSRYSLCFVILINTLVLSINRFDTVANKEAYKDWSEAEQLSGSGAKSAAIDFYSKAYQKLNQHPNFLMSYGNTLQELHRYDSALKIYGQVYLLQTSHHLLDNIAACYQGLGNNDLAERFYLRSIFTVPNRFTTRYHLFDFYLATNQINKAFICGCTILNLPIKISSIKVEEIRNNVLQKMLAIFLHEAKAILNHLKNT